jgi:uncharacterized membrane protein
MGRTTRVVARHFISCALIACGLLFGAPVSAADFRGFLEEGPAGLLVYRACQGKELSKQLIRVSDKSPETAVTAGFTAVREVMQDKQRPMYAEFAGELNGTLLTVRRFYRAIGHIQSCSVLPKDIGPSTRLFATGTNPPWRFVVDSEGGRLQLAGARPVRFPASALAAPTQGGKRVIDAWSAADGGSIHVEITEALCRDDSAETASGAQVVLRYGATVVEGCAARF